MEQGLPQSQPPPKGNVLSRHHVGLVVFLLCVACALRFVCLGNVFVSSDNVELPARIVANSGYLWMIFEPYGLMISLVVKVFVGLISALGINITEFWWIAPVALFGTLQVPLTFQFLRRLDCGRVGSLGGAGFVSVLPIHVMQSRYSWGYEVLGVFFVTIALWSLVAFFQRPTVGAGLAASLCSGLYLVSHGYIIPFIPCLAFVTLFADACLEEDASVPDRLRTVLDLGSRISLWVFPVLFLPVYYHSVRHALEKQTRLGIYVLQHGTGFLANTGAPLAVLSITAVVASIALRQTRTAKSILLTGCGALYLAPLFLGTPPGITVVRGYMLLGVYFWVLGAAVLLDRLAATHRVLAVSLICICFLATLWGTVTSVFGRDQLFDPTAVRIERGGVPPDPGTKAAAYLIRKYVPSSADVLAVHRAVEPPILMYYFGRMRSAYYDLSLEQTRLKLAEMRDHVDIVICEEGQVSILESDDRFVQKAVILSEGVPRMWIYARLNMEMPTVEADVRELNGLFDTEYALRVTLLPHRPGGTRQVDRDTKDTH